MKELHHNTHHGHGDLRILLLPEYCVQRTVFTNHIVDRRHSCNQTDLREKACDAQCQHPAADLSAQSKVPCSRLNDPHVQQIPHGEDCRGHLTDDSGNGCSHHAPPKSKNKDRVQNDIEHCPGKGRDHGKPRAAIRTDDGIHSLTEHVKRHAQCDVEEVFL